MVCHAARGLVVNQYGFNCIHLRVYCFPCLLCKIKSQLTVLSWRILSSYKAQLSYNKLRWGMWKFSCIFRCPDIFHTVLVVKNHWTQNLIFVESHICEIGNFLSCLWSITESELASGGNNKKIISEDLDRRSKSLWPWWNSYTN